MRKSQSTGCCHTSRITCDTMPRTVVHSEFLLGLMFPAGLVKSNRNIGTSTAIVSKCKNVHLINVTAITFRAGHIWLRQLRPHSIEHTQRITVTFRVFRSASVASRTVSSKLPLALAPVSGLSSVIDDPRHGTARTHHPAQEPQHKE